MTKALKICSSLVQPNVLHCINKEFCKHHRLQHCQSPLLDPSQGVLTLAIVTVISRDFDQSSSLHSLFYNSTGFPTQYTSSSATVTVTRPLL